MKFNGLKLAVVFALGILLVAATPAQAAFELKLDDGVNSITINSIGGCTAVGATGGCAGALTGVGFATYVGSVGSFTLNVTTGTTKGANIPPTLMDLNSINIQSAAAGANMVITWSDQDWMDFVPQFKMQAGGTLTAAAGSSAAYLAFYDAANGLGAETTLIGSLGPFGPGAFSGAVLDGSSPAAPYSLTQKLTYVFTSAGSTSGNYELLVVPEPASVALLGGVLLVACGALKRKFRHSA